MIPAFHRVFAIPAVMAFACLSMAILQVPAQAQTTPWNMNGSSIWYAPSGVNVGVGTSSATHLLHVYTNSIGSDTSLAAQVHIQNAFSPYGHASLAIDKGSSNASAAIALNTAGTVQWDLGLLDDNDFHIRLLGGSNPKIFNITRSSGYVGIGTTSPAHPLHVAGTIGATEVIVSSTGADYVFQPSYRLAPLSEVAAYVKAHHRLPDIPSASEVQKKGVSVGEMQTKLLAKVEELTLHVIEEHERNNRLEQRNRELEERLTRIEARGGGATAR